MVKNLIKAIIMLCIMIYGASSANAQTDYSSLPIFAPENMVVEEVQHGYPIKLNIFSKSLNGEMIAMGNNLYKVTIDKNRSFTFSPIEKMNEYSGETIPFNPSEFAKSPNLFECKIVSFNWEINPTDEARYHKLIAENNRLIAIENYAGKTFFIKPSKKYYIDRLNFDITVNPYDITRVIDRPYSGDTLTNKEDTLKWHPESSTLEVNDTLGYVLNEYYNTKLLRCGVKSKTDPLIIKCISITPGSKAPLAFDENENVLTLYYENGDYCKFSKIKNNELYDAQLHVPGGIIRASVLPNGELKTTFECTGSITGLGKRINDNYIGFSHDLGKLVLDQDPKNTKFDNISEIHHYVDYYDNNWYHTTTKEYGVWVNNKLTTESLKQKMLQEEAAKNDGIKQQILESYKAKYGATTINNIMQGKIVVGMPWPLVSSVFHNGLFESTSYSQTYKVVNNIPQIDISSRKLTKQQYGLGKLVYVTVENGKVVHVMYANHR